MNINTKYKKRKINPRETKSDRFRQGIKIWVGFYRENIHRFAKDYLGLDLHLFQMILLYLMNHINFFMYIAARGLYRPVIIEIL